MADILCLGEILVDWVCTRSGADLSHAEVFTKAAGGAPANVAVGLARQGVSTGFIGRVSFDEFGVWLKSLLEAEGIDTTNTVIDHECQTRMAYVVTTASGDRKLAEFSRIKVADANLSPSDLAEPLFAKAKVLHFGSISFISEPAAAASQLAIQLARKHGLLVSYDPNVRPGLWPSLEVCKATILQTLPAADIVKINLDELEFLTGSCDLTAAVKLQQEHNIAFMVVTLDSRGAFATSRAASRTEPSFPIDLVEATGAGDGFVAGILREILAHTEGTDKPIEVLSALGEEEIAKILQHANAIGALACTKPGAIPALPTLSEVKSFLEALRERSPTSFRV